MRLVSSIAIAAILLLGFSHANSFNAEKKTIKEVMKAGLAGNTSLLKKVLGGDASAEEKMKLLDLYIDLVENDAPKGDETEWKMMAGMAMLTAAKVVAGREGAIDELKKASDCKSCHDKFKGK
ncbi:MAG: hypothetical protein K9M08_02060 [Pirellula sp.]|jgi:hypothetical protein|nr:hypothetical protein [Pirellula sp.]